MIVRDIYVPIAIISRTWALTQKAVSRYASGRNDSVRVLWELQTAQYSNPNVFVFLDESAVDGFAGERLVPSQYSSCQNNCSIHHDEEIQNSIEGECGMCPD